MVTCISGAHAISFESCATPPNAYKIERISVISGVIFITAVVQPLFHPLAGIEPLSCREPGFQLLKLIPVFHRHRKADVAGRTSRWDAKDVREEYVAGGCADDHAVDSGRGCYLVQWFLLFTFPEQHQYQNVFLMNIAISQANGYAMS
jgi:hypothetical protein